MVLCTRLAPEPLAADGCGGMPLRQVVVEWQAVTDEAVRTVVIEWLHTGTDLP